MLFDIPSIPKKNKRGQPLKNAPHHRLLSMPVEKRMRGPEVAIGVGRWNGFTPFLRYDMDFVLTLTETLKICVYTCTYIYI